MRSGRLHRWSSLLFWLLCRCTRLASRPPDEWGGWSYGYTEAQVADLAALLGRLGFQYVAVQNRQIRREQITAATARR